MKRPVWLAVACMLALLAAGCRTTATRIALSDRSKWRAEDAIQLINDSFDAQDQVMRSIPPTCYIKGGSAEALESVKHIADRAGLTTVVNQGLMRLKVRDVPYTEIQSVETCKTDYFLVSALFCGLINPFTTSEFHVDLTRANGQKITYWQQSLAWNKWAVFPLWVIRPFYNHGGAVQKVQDIGEAFEFLRLDAQSSGARTNAVLNNAR